MSLHLLADFGATAILATVAIVSSVASFVLAANTKSDGGAEGARFGLRDNKADPQDPSPWVGGRPRYRPPLLSRWIRVPNLNSFGSVGNSKAQVGLLLDLGVGPFDGGGLGVWLDKTPVFEEVTKDSSFSERALARGTSGRKEWFFPKEHVQRDSVTVFLDDEPYGAARGAPLDRTAWAVTEIADKVRPSKFQVEKKDPVFFWINRTETVTGYLIDSALDEETIDTLTLRSRKLRCFGFFCFAVGDWEEINLQPSQWKIETDKQGRKFVRIIDDNLTGPRRELDTLSVCAKIFKNASGAAPVFFDLKVTDTGNSRAVFDDDVPAGLVSATFSSLPFGFEVETFLRTGALDQEPLPLEEGAKNSRPVGLELTQGLRRTFTTSREVSDLDVSIASGQGGFHGLGSTGIRGTTVPVRIRVRAVSAPDAPAPTSSRDPDDGWVELEFARKRELPLHGKIQGGIARWQFRASDGLGVAKLKRQQYAIEVTRLGPDTPGNGQREMFFESVTEIEDRQFSFPRRALLLVRFTEDEGLKQEPEVEVQLRARICKVFKGIQKVSHAEQLGRFLAQKGTNLPPGVTTDGGFVDISEFVFDPDLTEPVFDNEWTRNPVWLAVNLILDDLAGGGVVGFDSNLHIDWASALAAANFCERQVSFGGETRTAAEADIVLAKRTSLYSAVTRILAGSECSAVLSRGQWFFPFDVDEEDPDPTLDPRTGTDFTITDFDILDAEIGEGGEVSIVDGLQTTQKSLEQVATDFVISFPDEEAGFDQRADPVFIPAIEDDPARRITRRLEFPAVRRRWQVNRVGSKQAANELANQRVATIRCNNLYPYILDPGDIVVLQSPSSELNGRKAMIVHRQMGSNLRLELQVSLLGGQAKQVSFSGPNGGVPPGVRPPPTGGNAGGFANVPVPKSFIVDVEEV